MTDTLMPISADVRLDAMEAQLAFLVEEMAEQRRIRLAAGDLVHDLAPVSGAVMERLTEEFESLPPETSLEDLGRLMRTFVANAARLEALLAQLESLTELAQTLSELSGPALAMATERLGALEEKGYLDFARGGVAVADRVVTAFGPEDIEALGDNIVLILQTVREMTQPEVMTMLRRTALSAQHIDAELAEPPSLLGLAREMRDPEVRRGLGRTLSVLRTIGAEAAPAAEAISAESTTTSEPPTTGKE